MVLHDQLLSIGAATLLCLMCGKFFLQSCLKVEHLSVRHCDLLSASQYCLDKQALLILMKLTLLLLETCWRLQRWTRVIAGISVFGRS